MSDDINICTLTGRLIPKKNRMPSKTAKSIKLSAEQWEIARRLGDGNMSAGIRRALDISDVIISPNLKCGQS